MGPCQAYYMTLIYLEGEAEIQTVKKKKGSTAKIC